MEDRARAPMFRAGAAGRSGTTILRRARHQGPLARPPGRPALVPIAVPRAGQAAWFPGEVRRAEPVGARRPR
jgi:hypothetical protein